MTPRSLRTPGAARFSAASVVAKSALSQHTGQSRDANHGPVARGKVISTTRTAARLGDLDRTEWTIVGVRPAGADVWQWNLSEFDAGVLQAMVAKGDALTCQRREETGDWTLLAKLPKHQKRRQDSNDGPADDSHSARLYGWLVKQTDTIPRLAEIATLAGLPDAYTVHGTLGVLANAGRIAWRSGTRSEARGHQAIRIVATGRVLKTAGCPFEVPA